MNNNVIDFFENLRTQELTAQEIEREINKKNNPEITKKSYNAYLELVEGVKLAERERLKMFLLSDEQQERTIVRPLKPRIYIQYFAAAASILFLVFTAYTFLYFNHSVYQTYSLNEFSGNEMGAVEMSIDFLNPEKAYKKAIKLKKEEKFEAALVILQSIKKDNLLIQTKYNIALIHIKNRDYEKARVELSNLIQLDNKHYLVTKAKELQAILSQPKVNFFLFW